MMDQLGFVETMKKFKEVIINKFRSDSFYGNVYELLKVNDPKEYDRIKRKAKEQLNKEGKEADENAIDKFYLLHQVLNLNQTIQLGPENIHVLLI